MTGQEEYPRFISNRPCGNDKYEGKSQELSDKERQLQIIATSLAHL